MFQALARWPQQLRGQVCKAQPLLQRGACRSFRTTSVHAQTTRSPARKRSRHSSRSSAKTSESCATRSTGRATARSPPTATNSRLLPSRAPSRLPWITATQNQEGGRHGITSNAMHRAKQAARCKPPPMQALQSMQPYWPQSPGLVYCPLPRRVLPSMRLDQEQESMDPQPMGS